MGTDQQGVLADEKEEEISCKKQKMIQIEQPEFFVDKVKSTIPLQHTNHKAQSTNVATERSKETDGKMPLFGNGWQNMHKFQGKEPFICIKSSCKETSCLMSTVHGTESFDECNAGTSNSKAKISLIGVRRQKNGRYGAVITDTIRHKQVWLGTFDTVEEASQAYLSKKSELEKLSLQGNKDDKPKENLHQIQQPESPIVQCLSVANDQTFGTASVSRINSHETTHIDKVHKNKMSGEEPESSKETQCVMASVHGTESSDECNTSKSNPKAKISLIGVRRQMNGRYGAVITDTTRHKQVWLGTFDTVEEASQAYFSKKSELEKLSQQGNKDDKPKENLDQIQQPESPIVQCLSVANDQTFGTASVSRINSHETTTHILGVHKNKMSREEHESSKETPCVMARVDDTESSDECNTSTSNPKAKISLIGVRRQKNGRYGAVITDTARHKQVWLGTFDTVEEASQAYFSKKSELEKLSLQGNKDDKPKENLHQIQQPESPIVQCLSVANDQTFGTASVSRINSHETTHIDKVHKNKMSGEEPESSKETPCVMASVHGTESSDECNTSKSNPKAKISLIGVRRQKNGRYGAVITDTTRHKQVWLGTFDNVEEASQAYFSKKSELENEILNQQGNKENLDQIQQPASPIVQCLSVANDHTLDTASVSRINSEETTTHILGVHKNNWSGKEHESSKETSCLMTNVPGTESSNECNTTTSCLPTAKRSLLGIQRRKRGRYQAVITDQIRHKRVCLGTFDTIEEVSQAYLSKKFEFEKLREGNKENKPKKSCDQIQQPESLSVVASLDVKEALHAYLSKKFDSRSSKEAELQSSMPTDSSVGEKQEGQEDDEDLSKGQWIQIPGDDRAVMFSLKLGLPIIDNYGSLLGEFSSLDDLSISYTEDDKAAFSLAC